MASFTKLLHTIWSDPDFTQLGSAAQRLYLLLISQPDITAAGVVPLVERRWAALAPDTTVTDINAALEELVAAGFIVVDDATAELWVKSYIKHDEMYVSPNGIKAIEKARSRVLSRTINTLSGAALTAATEAPPEAPPETPPPGGTSPQQQATSTSNFSSSKQHSPSTTPNAAAAAADEHDIELALDLLIATRRWTDKVHNATGWMRTTAPKIRAEAHDTITAHLAAGRTPLDAVHHITGQRPTTILAAARKAGLHTPTDNVIPLDPGASA